MNLEHKDVKRIAEFFGRNEIKEVEEVEKQVKKSDFKEFISKYLQERVEVFEKKNTEYKSETDELANFTTGALLRYKSSGRAAQYEILKDYMTKHIAKVFDHDITHNVSDSLNDIVIYTSILAYIRECYEREQGYKE